MFYNLLVHVINYYDRIYAADPENPTRAKVITNTEEQPASNWDSSFIPTAHRDYTKYPSLVTDTAPIFVVPPQENPIRWPYVRNLEQKFEPVVVEFTLKFISQEDLDNFILANDEHPDLEEFYKVAFADYIDPVACQVCFRFQQLENTEV